MGDRRSEVARYSKPNILLLDVLSDCARVLRAAGYNVSEGSFGKAYEVERSGRAHLVSLESVELPNLNEQEVIVVNLAGAEFGDAPQSQPGVGVTHYWQSAESGVITPRAFAMHAHKTNFDKVFNHAGLLVVLTSQQHTFEYVPAKSYANGNLYDEGRIVMLDNWGFLEELRHTRVSNEEGSEILFENDRLGVLLRRGATGAYYQCSFTHPVNETEAWVPLAKNKYGNTVAGVYVSDKPHRYILLLPQMSAIHEILVELLEQWLAEWRPEFFPHLEGAKWVHRPEYEIPKVTSLQADIRQVQDTAKTRVESLRSEIEVVQTSNPDWYTLLCGTGDELVQAVIRSLRTLGFEKVIDVDAEEKKQGNDKNLREDIQIQDELPILVVDVKGINDCPADEESTQAAKHALMRMQEWKHTDVKALTIVNHQRHIPPHDRNPQPFRKEIVGNARQTKLGLLTTWDLFRILRNTKTLAWPKDAVKAIFYRSGRIEPIPNHYREIASIVKVWDKALGIIPTESVRIGDRLALEDGDSFMEVAVTSLNVNDKGVKEAPAKSNCGVGCDDASKLFREKARVFKVVQPK